MKRTLHLLLLGLATVLMAGCRHPGWIVSSVPDPATGQFVRTVYSEYFQDIQFVLDGRVKVNTLLTLGKERLPKGHVFSKKEKAFLKVPDAIEGVLETYFTNKSDEDIELELLAVSASLRTPNAPSAHLTLPAGKWVKTDPVVWATSTFMPLELPYSLSVRVEGQELKIAGTLKRLPATR